MFFLFIYLYNSNKLSILNLIFLLINRANSNFGIKLNILSTFSPFMSDELYEIDSAMNMIKEDIIRELSESITKQKKVSYFRNNRTNNLSFSEKSLD